jgi:uncharacterized protein (TIGR02284 family)
MANIDDNATLNTLIATLYDSIEGYEKSAGDARNPALSAKFTARAEERRRAVTTLQEAVRAAGGEPDDDGSLAGSVHRMFVNLKTAVTGNDDQAIVNEVERGEDYLKAKFEAALQTDLNPTARTAVQTAWESVRAGHDEMSQLKHSMQQGTA